MVIGFVNLSIHRILLRRLLCSLSMCCRYDFEFVTCLQISRDGGDEGVSAAVAMMTTVNSEDYDDYY